ncbi:MAG: hypothetical protein LQ338_007636 [Usnochroma carphineum]|nr:MAG: hypothetical protein LQ338_007636 [Usnochroma carphineum]
MPNSTGYMPLAGDDEKMASPPITSVVAVMKRLLTSGNKNPQATSSTITITTTVTTTTTGPTIFSLPSELHLEIAQYLPLSSRLALTQTCQNFCQLLYRYGELCTTYAFSPLVPGPVIGLSASHHPLFTENIDELERERQVFLSYVERDEFQAAELFFGKKKKTSVAEKGKGKGKDGEKQRKKKVATGGVWCSYCQDYHPVWLFTEHMLKAWRHERKCKGAEGKMWVCPHKQFDHQSVRDFTCSAGGCCGDETHCAYVNLDGVVIVRPVMALGRGWEKDPRKRPSYGEFKAAIKDRNVRICPHLRMKDRMVYGAAAGEKLWEEHFFKKSCGRLVDQGLGKIGEGLLKLLTALEEKLTGEKRDEGLLPRGKRSCGFCDTSWEFKLLGKDISLMIYRPFVHSHGVCHPAWYDQVASPGEMEELDEEWKMDAEKFEKDPWNTPWEATRAVLRTRAVACT